MFNQLILRAIEGELKGKKFIFNNETEYILGRSRDCSLLLDDPLYRVSRYHCRIRVFAPNARIQDLGSLNGTFVNGEKIGQRRKGQTFEQAMQEEHTDYPLWQGDKLRIGDNLFEVEFDPPPPARRRGHAIRRNSGAAKKCRAVKNRNAVAALCLIRTPVVRERTHRILP